MTKTDKEKLNEKLARWVGFKLDTWDDGEPFAWEYPDGKGYIHDAFNFTDSLDACFKWLVPKLPSTHDILLSHSPDCAEWHCDILGSNVYIGETESPALSLCLAIEKLIDTPKEKK